MKFDNTQEKEALEQKVRDVRKNIVQQIEKGRFFGLDHQVRQVQKQFQLMSRI